MRASPLVATFGSVSITEIAITSPPWIKEAACRDVPDPEIFYPERGGSPVAARASACGFLSVAGCDVPNEGMSPCRRYLEDVD